MSKKAVRWQRGGYGHEDKENSKKVLELELAGLAKLKKALEESPEAEHLRAIDGVSFEVNEDRHILQIGMAHYPRCMGIYFRYPRGRWSRIIYCTGLAVSGMYYPNRPFGRHYGYDFETNTMPPVSFKKMVKGIGEFMRGILHDRHQRVTQEMAREVALQGVGKVLKAEGYEVTRHGNDLGVVFPPAFLEKIPQKMHYPVSVTLKATHLNYLVFSGMRDFRVKADNAVEFMGALGEFYLQAVAMGALSE